MESCVCRVHGVALSHADAGLYAPDTGRVLLAGRGVEVAGAEEGDPLAGRDGHFAHCKTAQWRGPLQPQRASAASPCAQHAKLAMSASVWRRSAWQGSANPPVQHRTFRNGSRSSRALHLSPKAPCDRPRAPLALRGRQSPRATVCGSPHGI